MAKGVFAGKKGGCALPATSPPQNLHAKYGHRASEQFSTKLSASGSESVSASWITVFRNTLMGLRSFFHALLVAGSGAPLPGLGAATGRWCSNRGGTCLQHQRTTRQKCVSTLKSRRRLHTRYECTPKGVGQRGEPRNKGTFISESANIPSES